MPTASFARVQITRTPTRAACVAVLVNLSLMALQLGVGRTAGAQAMVADGIHSLVDVVVDSVIALSVWLAHRRTGPHIGKLVPAASALVSVLIVVTGIEFLMKGFSSASAADDIVQGPIRIVTFAMAFAAIAVKAGLYYGMNAAAMRAASAGGNADSTNALKAGAWHACVDSISAGVAAIGTAGTLAGWPAVDRTASAVIGAMILGVGLMQLSQPLRHGYRVLRNLCAPLNHRYARFSNWLLERPPAR
ncbi:Cation efflux family protein [Paraburkholderia caballeronis]|nr:Cation efflux family protein [Paraburkholderia caballeronis]